MTGNRTVVYSNRTARVQRDMDELARDMAKRIGVTVPEMRAMDDLELTYRLWNARRSPEPDEASPK